MSNKKLKDIPLVSSALQIDINQKINPLEKPAKKTLIWEKIGIYALGLMSFLIGIFIFLPLDDLALEGIKSLNLGKNGPQFSHISLSLLGNFKAKKFTMNIPNIGSSNIQKIDKNIFDSKLLEGDISLLGALLFNTLNSKITMHNFNLDLTSDLLLSIRGEAIHMIFEIVHFSKGINSIRGKVQFNGIDLLGNYSGIVPGIGEQLGDFLISNIIGEIQIKSKVLRIKDFRIESNLADIKLKGTLGLSNPTRTNLTFIINPSGFIQKYAENNIEPLLKNLGFLHDDGKIFYECRNGLKNCAFRKTKDS